MGDEEPTEVIDCFMDEGTSIVETKNGFNVTSTLFLLTTEDRNRQHPVRTIK